MNLLDTAQLLGNIGEFVGAFVVVATHIYLAVQIRQNSSQIALNSHQIATERYAGQALRCSKRAHRYGVSSIGLGRRFNCSVSKLGSTILISLRCLLLTMPLSTTFPSSSFTK
jgi:hypothetical protein